MFGVGCWLSNVLLSKNLCELDRLLNGCIQRGAVPPEAGQLENSFRELL